MDEATFWLGLIAFGSVALVLVAPFLWAGLLTWAAFQQPRRVFVTAGVIGLVVGLAGGGLGFAQLARQGIEPTGYLIVLAMLVGGGGTLGAALALAGTRLAVGPPERQWGGVVGGLVGAIISLAPALVRVLGSPGGTAGGMIVSVAVSAATSASFGVLLGSMIGPWYARSNTAVRAVLWGVAAVLLLSTGVRTAQGASRQRELKERLAHRSVPVSEMAQRNDVEGLLWKVKNGSTSAERVVAVSNLRMKCTPEHPEILKALREATTDGDAQVRWQAVSELGQLADPGSAQALGAALKDQMPAIRKAAALALWKIKTPEIEPLLQQAAQDPDPDVRQIANKVLHEPYPNSPQGKSRDQLLKEAYAAMRANDMEKAVAKCREVLKIDAQNTEAHWCLAWALSKLGRKPEAIAEFKLFADARLPYVGAKMQHQAEEAIARLQGQPAPTH